MHIKDFGQIINGPYRGAFWKSSGSLVMIYSTLVHSSDVGVYPWVIGLSNM